MNINPRDADAYLNRGVLCAGQGNPDLALSDFNPGDSTLISSDAVSLRPIGGLP
ncbi:MAG UNVERIFIED_CONTAM: tetratricopeptide repeat protein [Microcystis novacekii LVE1205-3]